MDKNSTIGLVLIGAILLVYFTFFRPTPSVETVVPQPKKEITNSKSQAVTTTSPLVDSNFAALPSKDVVLENEKIKVVISTLGAKVKSVELKEHKDYKHNQLILIDEKSFESKLNVATNLGNVDLNTLNYNTNAQNSFLSKEGDSTVAVFETSIKGQKVIQTYSLKYNSYLLGKNIDLSALSLKNKTLSFEMTDFVKRTESDPKVSKTQTTINAYNGDDIESLSETSLDKETKEVKDVKWFTFKTKFFLAGILPNEAISKLNVSSIGDALDTTTIKVLEAKGELAINNGKTGFNYYLGPNHYQTCKKIADNFGDNVYLGWPVFRSINKFVIIPIFNFLEGIFSNYGLIIFLLVLTVKLVLFPLSYRSYLSMAKIKVLKPELDEIKARVGEDMQAQQQEQMKLYQSVGVNPLAGCIPVLLQMPILLSMFNFFPNAIELRQKSFLWATDLSTYDTFIKLPFEVPFGYGDHVSLFTILMTISTLLYTWYNSQMQASMTGPMKYMQYVMPLIFLFVMNSMSAGLTYYYFISNIITIAQQFIIKSRVDETKIRAKLDTYKTNVKEGTVKKSRWQQRLEDAMKAQEEAKKSKKK
jgi:YidC/Oxa1 family membrane protein insertase